MRSFERWMILGCCSLVTGMAAHQLLGQGVEVSGKIVMRAPTQPVGKKRKETPSAANVVVWLSPIKPGGITPVIPARQSVYRLVQKDKMFTPHMLVVPTGSQVEFPNQDPFFHNVFSLFNGKRFDLGLYESGTSRSVRFDREGVSYIFCNIHPEMGAIVLALNTPYYGISGENGIVGYSQCSGRELSAECMERKWSACEPGNVAENRAGFDQRPTPRRHNAAGDRGRSNTSQKQIWRRL